MDKPGNDTLQSIIKKLREKHALSFKAFLGFDACIDNIVRVVKDRAENAETSFYTRSSHFGEFLIRHENKSCGIELHTEFSKIGGNMVITGNALGNLGFSVDCVGTFGLPEILPVFRSMSQNCTLHSVGETISATALEFNDSKIIMFDPGPYNKLNWKGIKDQLGIDQIKMLMSGKQLVSFLNWSEIENSSQIWQGFLDEVIPVLEPLAGKRVFFTDFADCTRRSKKEIRSAIDIIIKFRSYYKVVISLNQNEADVIASAFDLSHGLTDKEFIRALFGVLNPDVLVIHRSKDALAYDGIEFERSDTFFCKSPKILTGGGDNFNAGFCYALFHDFNLFQSLIVANAVSGKYVKTGISPNIDDLIWFLESETDMSK